MIYYPFNAIVDSNRCIFVWNFCIYAHGEYWILVVLTFFNFLKMFYLFIFGYAGSSLLHRLFSSCGKQELLCGCGAQASHCGFFLQSQEL